MLYRLAKWCRARCEWVRAEISATLKGNLSREIGQRRNGSYEANKSRTLPVPVGRLYRAFSVSRTRRRWLPDVDLTVRRATPDKSMCITWNDGSSVEVYFTVKDALHGDTSPS